MSATGDAQLPCERSGSYGSGSNRAVRGDLAKWIGEGGKIVVSAVLAGCFLWVQVEAHGREIERLNRESEARAARVQAIESSLNTLKADQAADVREVMAGIRRVEESLKEVRIDVKELQRRP